MSINKKSIYILHKESNCKGLKKFRYPFAWLIKWNAIQSGHPVDLPNPNHTAGLFSYQDKIDVFETVGSGVRIISYIDFLKECKKQKANVWIEECFDTNLKQIEVLHSKINEMKNCKYAIKKALKTVLYNEYNTPISFFLKNIIKLLFKNSFDSQNSFFCTEFFIYCTAILHPSAYKQLLKKADISIIGEYPIPHTAQPHSFMGFFSRNKDGKIDIKYALSKQMIKKVDIDLEILKLKV